MSWFKLHRSTFDHWISEDPVKFRRWLLLLSEVNFNPSKFNLGNNIYNVPSGGSTKSIRQWSRVFECGTKAVINFFDLLESDGMIERKTIGKGKHSTTLVIISNYGKYQGEQETLTDTQATTLTTTQAQREGHTEEELKKERKKELVDWSSLIAFYNKVFSKQSRVINDKVKRKYRARLKEGYTKQDITNSMRNAKKNSFHKENGYQYCTLEFFSRSDTLDKYMHEAPKKNNTYIPTA